MDNCKPKHRRYRLRAAVLAATAVLAAPLASAGWGGHNRDNNFHWIGSFDVMAGNGSGVAEIIDVTRNNRQLVYTDAEKQQIGFVDIRFPWKPRGQGVVDVGGEPTSLVIKDPYVLVGVNTSASFTEPSGKLVVVHKNTRQVVAEYDLGGQPDSIALAPDRKRAAIVIENERDEDLNDGLLPQLPSGGLKVVELWGPVDAWNIFDVDLSPVTDNAVDGSDLEPEYVDINRENEAVVSFQENNHLAVVDIVSGTTLSEFSAGSVALSNVDTAEEDLITLDSDIVRRREPDAVTWIDDDSFATANEGDYEDMFGEEGGSRGFTIFNQDGTVEFESAESFEHLLVSVGHYNESRSENKGVEPESVESARFWRDKLLFVGSERSNAVGVYDVSDGEPELKQVLPTGIGPEGIKAIPWRGLLAVSTESEVADAGIPTMINLYHYSRGESNYPMIQSAQDDRGLPIPWVALSGLAGDPFDADTLYAVSDSFLGSGFIYTVDVSSKPASIVDRLEVSGASQGLDLEGIAVGPDGNFWLGSEGNADSRENQVLKVDPLSGEVSDEIELPAGMVDQRRSNGIEGIAVTGAAGAEVVYVAIQRAWPEEGDTDEVNTKIGRYDVATGEWGFVHYPLQPEGNGDWIGLSELTAMPDGSFVVIERDKGWGPSTAPNAELKALYRIKLKDGDFRAFDDPRGLVTIRKRLFRDVLPELARNSIWNTEKLEGFAVSADERMFIVTDNDGVDDAPGETVFLELRRRGHWRGR
ncbi:MAG: alkaline phosphatase [Halioglobus sp.]|nr:alkaline phosphatase [Halioglobus sp.]|tara:strand:+ start:393 stop:2657 length:2265 start_codon:yes stop_codon:yes gene_type:complete